MQTAGQRLVAGASAAVEIGVSAAAEIAADTVAGTLNAV